MRICALRPYDLRTGLIRFQRCLGEWSRFGAINKANRLFECGSLYTALGEIASIKRMRRVARTLQIPQATGSVQTADLLLGHHALDVLGLALDTVARTPIRLDRQASDNGVDTALLDDGAALRPLKLVVNVVVDRVIVGHRVCFR